MTRDDDRQALREAPPEGLNAQRLDKWLWFARITKSRTLAAQLVEDGKVRVNRTRAAKPSQSVRVGDVLTIAIRGQVQVLRVVAPGARRGPQTQARQLYAVVSAAGGTKATTPGTRSADPAAPRHRLSSERSRDQEG
jgi:ribosome-associated heat shock protein Hsp15